MAGFQVLRTKVFGEFSRYKLAECRDRFGEIVFIVTDAETIDELTGLPDVIRIKYAESEAVEGLAE